MSQTDNLTTKSSLDYFFHPRLSFLSRADQIVSKCNAQLSQNHEFYSEKKLFELGSFIGEIKTEQHISTAYEHFYSLIYHCKFDQKSVQQTSNISREQIKKKRVIKDIENQRTAKVKKTLTLLGQSQRDYDYWREILNHKNLFLHISKAKIYLKEIIEKNFQLIEQGTAKIKNSQICNAVQIKLCILVMDIISLINTMRFMLNPFNETDALVSKLIQQETILYEQACNKFNKNGELNVVNGLISTKIFYDAIKFIITQISAEEKVLLFWFELEQIRQRYLVEQNGLMRLKPIESYKKKIDAAIVSSVNIPFQISQIQLQWLNVYNQYFLFSKISIEQDMSDIFKQYCHFFNYHIDELIRKQEKQQNIENYVGSYFEFMRNIWVSIDKKSAEKIYIDESFKINNKFKLPLNLVKKASTLILEKINREVEQFTQLKNKNFLKKLRTLTFQLSEKILQLQSKEDLFDDYFIALQKAVKSLLNERFCLNQLFQKIYDYQTNIQLAQFFTIVSKIQKLLSDQGQSPIKNLSNKQEELDEVIESLYETYEDEESLVDEVKYFLKTVKALSKVQVNDQQLENAKEFYSKQKNQILSPEKIINQQKLSLLPYGLLDFIRILIYELIFKIKLKVTSQELDQDQKYLFGLLKFFYQEKVKNKKQIQDNIDQTDTVKQNTLEQQEEDEDLDVEAAQLFLKKIKSQEINFDRLKTQSPIKIDSSVTATHVDKSHKFALNYLKKIYELRLEIIRKNMKELQLKEKPLEKEYTYMRNIIYTSAIKGGSNNMVGQDVKQLAQIQCWCIKKRYHRVWRGIKRLKNIEEVKDLLEGIWSKSRNILKIHIKIYLKYQQIYFNSKLISNRSDISQNEVTNLVDDILKSQQIIITSDNLEESKEFVEELKSSVRILDRIEKVQILRREIEQRDEEKRSLQEAKTYDLVLENNQFSVLNGKLKIYRVEKLGTVVMRKYIITCPNKDLKNIQKKLEILKKLSLNNINVQIKDLEKIQMVVDQVQNQFDSYSKLVKYLIEAYYRVIMFCKNKLDFKVDPIMKKKDFQIQIKNDKHYNLKINPYEGILLNLLLTEIELERSGVYMYPKHPFVAFSDEIKNKFKDQKIYSLNTSDKVLTTEQYGFYHLLEEMKSISLENDPKDISQVLTKIFKCPYFWSQTDKSFELIEFKERYQSMINIEECRRKENDRIRKTLDQQEQETFTFEPLHPQYQRAYGYHKTTQMYFSIEGVMQKQAFLEDIGNFRSNGKYKEFRLQNYHWDQINNLEQKKIIIQLIGMIAKKQRKKGIKNSNTYRRTFPSFHAQIRNLRNLLSHYIYDKEKKIEYSLEYKISLIEKSFPKLFIFIYRWKPYLNKNFEQIQAQRVNILLSLFNDEDKDEVIQRLHEIKEFKKYNEIVNPNKKNLLRLFKYSFDDRYDCKACNIMCMLLKNKNSFWDLLADSDDPNAKSKEGKQNQNPPYNYLFYEHKKFGCNGMQFLLPYFLNVMRRNGFTSEESAEMKSSINQLRLKVEKLNRKIENLSGRGYEDDEEFSQNSSYTSDEEKVTLKKETLPVEIRCLEMSQKQRKQYLEEMLQFDYVNKNTIYQLQLTFPYLFDDLRKQRHQWDMKARSFNQEQ